MFDCSCTKTKADGFEEVCTMTARCLSLNLLFTRVKFIQMHKLQMEK